MIAGLDVGTYKVGVVVAEVAEGRVDVTGVGTAISTGLRKGIVINIDATVDAIRQAVGEAELMAGCEIRNVIVSAGGTHLKGLNSHGVVPVRSREVTKSDVDRVVEAARAVALPTDREVLHLLPQEFVVDDQDGIKQPVGMMGVRLEARVHIVTGGIGSGKNLIKCCNRAGLHVDELLGAPLACAEAVLAPEERELGVALLDLGAGTTSLLVVYGGAVRHSAVLPLGSGYVTSDLAAYLRTPLAEAETLKIRHGTASAIGASPELTVEVPGIGGRAPQRLSPRALAEVIEPRVFETLRMARDEVARAGCAGLLTSGVVLTGGGSLLHGITDLAERVFRGPVRLGAPAALTGLVDAVASPMYATGVGLVLHGKKQHDRPVTGRGSMTHVGRIGQRLVDLIRDFF
ncbi:MAG TPA: cell division protein FtsA [Actinomycetota bacterium]